MPEITTFLTFNDQALEAAELYIATFGDGRITSVQRMPPGGPGTEGKVFGLTFELFGKSFNALNGGPSFKFAEGISLFVSCDTQDEIDRYWAALTRDGGKEVQCGWLVDKFGVSWQIIPKKLGSLLGGPDPVKAGRAMQAMLGMQKLDIAALERAYEGG